MMNNNVKLIYKPKGPAAEYGGWACNLYNGCSNECDYCYNRHNQGKFLLGKKEVTPKGNLSESELLILFQIQLNKHKQEIIDNCDVLFFNFVSDPCLPETINLNWYCIKYALINGVTVRVLTKMAYWTNNDVVKDVFNMVLNKKCLGKLQVGFTITGCDILEPYADSNWSRIETMKMIHNKGIFVWCSMEPVINIEQTKIFFDKINFFCRMIKVGIIKGKKNYNPNQFLELYRYMCEKRKTGLTFKKTVIKFLFGKKEQDNIFNE